MSDEITEGHWLGESTGLTVREPAGDHDLPILEIHGDEAMAAVQIDASTAKALSHVSGELQLVHEDRENE